MIKKLFYLLQCVLLKTKAHTIFILRLFLPSDNFFDIILVFVFFPHYDICFFLIFSFYFFLLQLSFYIYLSLAILIFLHHFHNNLLLYLVSHLCFFDNKLNELSDSILYTIKKKFMKHPQIRKIITIKTMLKIHAT